MINHCKACDERWEEPYHATKHYCSPTVLAARYGGKERTYRNIRGTVDGWHQWRQCSVCGSRDIVATRSVKLSDRVWCAAHVGKNRGTLRANEYAVFVTACY